MHYRRRDIVERFREKVVPLPSGCHRWIGYTMKSLGYGGFSTATGSKVSRMVYAHRFAYELANGPIPEGRQIHHTCENRWCVNPDHLALVTLDAHNAVHRKRWAINKAKTHCLRGHPFTEENTYRWSRKPSMRQCRQCNAIRNKERRK